MKLIDKNTLVAEIEKLVDKGKYHDDYDCAFRDGNNAALYALKEKINTLEVKKADLEKEVDTILEEENYEYQYIDHYKFAKHFFELGLKAQ